MISEGMNQDFYQVQSTDKTIRATNIVRFRAVNSKKDIEFTAQNISEEYFSSTEDEAQKIVVILEPFGNISEIRREVKRQFGPIAQVQAIYGEYLSDELMVWVFTSEDHYDDTLMDTLLDREIDILHMYPDTTITFRYIPAVLCQNYKEATGNNAKLIFKR